MIACPVCKTIFTPRHQVCPRCRKYEAKLEERLDYLADAAEAALDQGAAPADVEDMLVDEGMPTLVAAEIVAERARKVTRAERSYGLKRVLGGLGLFVIAGIMTVFGILALPNRTLLYLGLAFFSMGAYPFIQGVYSIWTGRE